MGYTYGELKIMLYETERAFDTMRKLAELNNEFLMREDIKPLYEKFLLDKFKKNKEQSWPNRLIGEKERKTK